MMAEIVYILRALTSIACALLLYRGFRRSGTPLLFWSGLCFAGLALNNVLLLVDLYLFPQIDLLYLRTCAALVGVAVLLYGLVWNLK
jgi:hypothetical protein